jgi:hypothetical protein
MTPLEKKTKEFMETDPKHSHKRTRLFLEMQELVREEKRATRNQSHENPPIK